MVRKLTLFTILLTIFVDFFNLGLIYPLFTSLMFSTQETLINANSSDFFKNCIFGLLVAAYPCGQLMGAPIIGQLSDKYGRRPLLIVSLHGTVITLLLCALGIEFKYLSIIFLSRFLGGIMAGNMTLAYATLADYSTNTNRVRLFAFLPAVSSLAFAISPFLASELSDSHSHTWANATMPFMFAAAISIINLIVALTCFPETTKPIKNLNQKVINQVFKGINQLTSIVKPSIQRPYLLALFLMISANFLFVQFVGPLAIAKFNVHTREIGYVYTITGLGAGLGNLFLTRWLSSKLLPQNALKGSLLILCVLLAALILCPTFVLFQFICFLIMLACAVGYTNSMAMVSNLGNETNQGETMGVAVAIQNGAEFIPASIVGFFTFYSRSIPMLVAIGCALGCYTILKMIQKKFLTEPIN